MAKKILVTGASGGIGTDLCHCLSSKGYDLVLCARDEGKLSSLKKVLEASYENKIETASMDFVQKNSFENFKRYVETGIDGLVIMPPQAPATTECLPEESVWKELFDRSFIGPVSLIKYCVPYLEKKERSKIAIVSGISSAQVLSHYATSSVLRTAWLGQAKTLAFALGEKAISVNTLSLGGVMTEKYKARVKKRADEAGKDYESFLNEDTANVPLRKYADPKEVAIAIETLLSPFADHITGENIMCDGGFTRRY